MATSSSKRSKKTDAKVEPMVYIGPTLPHGLLARYAVFCGGDYPPHIKELRSKSAALRGLFVPVSQLHQAKQDVAKQGNILNLYAKNVLKELNN